MAETEAAAKAAIDGELEAAFAKMAEIAKTLPPPAPGVEGARAAAEAGRVYWNEGGPEMAIQRDETVAGPYRDIPVRVYRPSAEEGLPVYIYFHGGGFRQGSERSNDRQMREIAARWGGIVISSDYVHIPEYTFPAPVEEAMAVYEWVADNGARWGIDPGRIAIGGASAGGAVSLGAAVGFGRKRPGVVKAAALVYPVLTDDFDCESMRLYGEGGYRLTRDGMVEMFGDYMPNRADWNDPRALPGKANPADLPPLFLASSELDPLRDQALTLARKLEEAGRPVVSRVYPGMVHTFFGLTREVGQARACVNDLAAFLADRLGRA